MIAIEKQTHHMYITRGDAVPFTALPMLTNGSAYPIQAGDKMTFSVRKMARLDSPVILKADSTDGSFELSAGQTMTLEIGDYVYDVSLTKANGEVFTYIQNDINHSPALLTVAMGVHE